MEVKDVFESAKHIPKQDTRPAYVELLNQHPFTLHVMEHLNPLMPVFYESAMQWATTKNLPALGSALDIRKQERNANQFSQVQRYTLDVFVYIANLLNAVERLEEIQVYIGGFPQPRTYEKLGITQDKWIHYHYSHYTIIITGIYDTFLLLTNAVFRLGLNPRKCSEKTIIGNPLVLNTDIKRHFDGLEKIVSPYRQPRNLYAHRSESPKFELLEMLELFSVSKIQRNESLMLDWKLIDALYRMMRSEITAALDEEIINIVNVLELLFQDLGSTYESNHTMLVASK